MTHPPQPNTQLTAQQSNHLADDIRHTFYTWKEQRQGTEHVWSQCLNAYQGVQTHLNKTDAPANKTGFKLHRPAVFEAVEQLQSTLMDALLPNQLLNFSVRGKTEADHRHANEVKQLLESKLSDAQLFKHTHQFIKQLLITGNSVMAFPWKKQTHQRPIQTPLKRLGVTVGYETTWQEMVLYNAPQLECLNVFDVLLDPTASDPNQASLIRRFKSTLRELEADGLYQQLALANTELAKQQRTSKRSPLANGRTTALANEGFNLDEQIQAQGVSSSNTAMPASPLLPTPVHLLEAWGTFVLQDGTVLENHVITVLEETGTLIRCEAHGYTHTPNKKPFLWGTLTPVPNQLYGLGMVEPVLGLQYAINAFSNQKLDVLNLCINAPYTYLLSDDVFDPNLLLNTPGALIPVKSHDTLRPLPLVAQNVAFAYEEINDLKAELMEASGVGRLLGQGYDALNKNKTALEVDALVSQGQQKVRGMVAHVEQSFLEPLLANVYGIMQRMDSPTETVQRLDAHGNWTYTPLATPWLPSTYCQFEVAGVRGALQQQKDAQSLLQLLEVVRSLPNGVQWLNIPELLHSLGRYLGLKPSVFQASPPALESPPH
ncbi:MAG: portal protein [Vampirovibrionales bacterium]